MNDQEKFEEQLREQPFRSMPAEWRSQILSAATAECRGGAPVFLERAGRRERRATSNILRGLLWPHPVAWGALAAVWLLIAGLTGVCGTKVSRELRVPPRR